jgi:hypothetical protein
MIMNSTFFATLYSALITPLLAQLQAMIGTVCSTMQPIALVMLTIWLAFVGADIAFGHKTLPAACKDFCGCGLRDRPPPGRAIHAVYQQPVSYSGADHHWVGTWRRYKSGICFGYGVKHGSKWRMQCI